MSIHPTLPGNLSQDEFAEKIIASLSHMLPLNSIRRVSEDEIAIEDDAGRDWKLVIYRD